MWRFKLNETTPSFQYLQELARFQGSISAILNEINNSIKNIPDRRDQEELNKKIRRLSELLKQLDTKLSEYFSSNSKQHLEFETNVDKLVECLTTMEEMTSQININKIYEINNRLQALLKAYNPPEDDELIWKDIKEIHEFTKKIKEYVATIEILAKDKNVEIKPSDIFEIFEYIKNKNKLSKLFSSFKTKILIGGTITVTLITLLFKFFGVITKIIEFFT